MHYTEYDEHGVGTEHEILWDPLNGVSEEALAQARLELTTKWGASASGSKANPDNAHGLFVPFWARVPDEKRRICPCIEIGGFWRKGAGIRIGQKLYGLWFPWFRPRRPRLDTPERIDLSPAELLGAGL